MTTSPDTPDDLPPEDHSDGGPPEELPPVGDGNGSGYDDSGIYYPVSNEGETTIVF